MRSLSAIQPSGQLHVGNYFGSIKPNIEMSASADLSFYFVVDLHALTTLHDPQLLRQYRKDAVLDILACGLDPETSVIFYQSHVPEHTELAWLLACMTPVGLLERAVSYKDKVAKGISASSGLLTYPVLMAADIIMYDIDVVPVGKDQKQHVEMARDIAIKFNNTFGDTLAVPEPQIREETAVVPGTDGQKMSKSYGNTVPLFGDEKAIRKAIMGIVTDSKDVKEPKDPDTSIIFQMHKLFVSKNEADELAARYRAGGLGYGDAKKMLLETYMNYFADARRRRAELKKKPAYVAEVMKEGAKKAKAVAEKTMARARKAVGLE